MKKLYILLAICLPLLGTAQIQPIGNLTVFSEDGDKFYLILNGEKQNDIPQTNIRIEELPQPYYSARVIFADSTIAPISKNNLMITDADGTMMDVTYRIRKDKSRKAKMNPYSMIAVQRDFIAPSGMYVHRFGDPAGVSIGVGGVRTTTTTTTTNGVGANVNLPGVNVNIAITDPIETYSTTTTTTSSSSTHQQEMSNNSRNCNFPMKAGDFSAAKETINESSFDETKLSTAKSIVSNNCLSTDQVVQICNLFSFDASKLDFAKFAYRYTTDPKNYFKVNNVFSFSSDKEALNNFISSGQ